MVLEQKLDFSVKNGPTQRVKMSISTVQHIWPFNTKPKPPSMKAPGSQFAKVMVVQQFFLSMQFRVNSTGWVHTPAACIMNNTDFS